MSEQKHTEKSIEQLLHSMPKVPDNRSKEEVLERLRHDERLTHTKRKKRNNKWLPTSIVALAALLLLAIIVPLTMQQKSDQPVQFSTNESSDQATTDTFEKRSSVGKFAAEESMENEVMNDRHYAVFQSDVEDTVPFHIGLAGDQAMSIPVTFLLPKELVQADLGTEQVSEVELYNTYAAKLDEQAMGFQPYHPYKGHVTEEGETVTIELEANHGYDVASGTVTTFGQSLIDTFGTYNEVKLRDENKETATFRDTGVVDPIDLQKYAAHHPYFIFTQEDGQQYLTPNFGQQEATVEDALTVMKEQLNDVYQSAIPDTVQYDVVTKGDVVTIQFQVPLDLTEFDEQTALQLIEALLLTGASFDKQIELQNVVQQQWNRYDFTKPLPIPIGANPVPPLFK